MSLAWETNHDDKLTDRHSCSTYPCLALSVVYFYPRLIPLHNISIEETGVPNHIRCTIEKVRDDGVYLFENGIHVLLFVCLATDPSWIQV